MDSTTPPPATEQLPLPKLLVLPMGRNMTAMDIDAGLLFFFAVGAGAELAVFMAGWSSRNKYSLFGAMRAIAQMISYEIPFILSTVSVIMIAGSLSPVKIVEAQQTFNGWLPDWFVRPIDPDRVGEYSREAWLVTLAGYLVLNGFVGPIVEELYFRGYLLPRMEWMGRWAPLVNVSLFSLYHFWSPWQVLGRILGLGPTVYAVRWKENVYLGMVVHCSLNTLGIILIGSLVLSRI